MPEEETFRVPLKYIDVNRTTHTNWDVLQEKRMDDWWNVDAHRSSLDSWKGLTMFTLLNEKTSKKYTLSGWRLAKIQATARPDQLWPEIWSCMSKAAQEKEKHDWAVEKTMLTSARRLRRISFIDLEDGEYKETIINARKNGSPDGGMYALKDVNEKALEGVAGNCSEGDHRIQQKDKACMHRGGS